MEKWKDDNKADEYFRSIHGLNVLFFFDSLFFAVHSEILYMQMKRKEWMSQL